MTRRSGSSRSVRLASTSSQTPWCLYQSRRSRGVVGASVTSCSVDRAAPCADRRGPRRLIVLSRHTPFARWVLDGPTWPKQACFCMPTRRKSGRKFTRVARGEPTWPAKLLKKRIQGFGEGGIRTHVPVTRQDAFEAPPLRPLRYLSVRGDRVKRTLHYTCAL